MDFEIGEVWRALPEFANPIKTYDEFKAAILRLYPDASEDNRYSLSDVDLLIGERQRLGINSVNDLADFYMRFISTTNWLIARRRFSVLEQQRSYIRSFPSSLLTSILTQLQNKFPTQGPDLPYPCFDVYKAALIVLRTAPASLYRTQYSLTDIDILIGERLRLGIYSADGLDDFHKQFLEITNWLIDKGRLSDLEQQRSYIRAFRPSLLTSILTRLQNKFPDQHPDIPYNVSDVYKEALFVVKFEPASVHSSRYSPPATSLLSTPSPAPPAP